jgi:hypothetical protein
MFVRLVIMICPVNAEYEATVPSNLFEEKVEDVTSTEFPVT